MNFVSGRDIGDLCVALFPRASYRVRRVLLGLRAARGARRDDLRAPARRPWLRADGSLLTMTELASPSARARARVVTIDGLEYLDAALARGHGVILWLASFGDRTVGIMALVERGYPVVLLHGAQHGGSLSWFGQRVIRPMYRRIEARLVEDVITMDEGSLGYLRRVVDRLKSNKIVGVPALGSEGNKFVALPVFGETRYFPTGMMTLARQTDAALMGAFGFAEGQTHRLVLTAPFPVRGVEKGDRGLVSLARLYVAQMTAHAARHPTPLRWPDPPERLDELTILRDGVAEAGAP